jgi:predicted esterase
MVFLRDLCLGYFLLCMPVSSAQDTISFRAGEVAERVLLMGQTEESFALYLPRSYNPQIPVPALFVFDPGARGHMGVETFKEAAETLGWIVIGSNDSRNGPYERSFGQANRLFADVLSRFNIHGNHIYVAGFSGGARLVTTLAVLSDQVRGVIACGAAFSPNPGQIPMVGANFSFAGIVGNRDMNFQEMRKAAGWLGKIELPHRMFFFDGGHRWPPRSQIERALNWMSFQTGAVSPALQPELYRDYFEGERILADSLYANGRYFESDREYQKLIEQFGGSFPMDSIWARLSEIRTLGEYGKQKKRDAALAEREATLRKRFSNRFRDDVDRDPPTEKFSWWQREKTTLDAKLVASDMEGENNLGARIYNFLFAMSFEASQQWRRENQYDKSRYCARLLTVLFPENSYAQVRLAEEYALTNKPEEMIASLERAKEMGHADVMAIFDNPLFKPYVNRDDFPFHRGEE